MAEPPDLANDRFRRPRGGRAGGQDVGDGRIHGLVEGLVALDDLVDEPDPQRPQGIEAATARKERPSVRFADFGDHEWGDHRRQDPQARFGEPELRPGLGDHQVCHRTQAHAPAERGTVDARDHRDGARVDGVEHVGHGHRVVLVALDVELHRRAHPVDVGTRTERGSLAGKHDRPERRRILSCEGSERRGKLGDHARVERVVGLGTRQRHPRDDAIGPCPRDEDGCHRVHPSLAAAAVGGPAEATSLPRPGSLNRQRARGARRRQRTRQGRSPSG